MDDEIEFYSSRASCFKKILQIVVIVCDYIKIMFVKLLSIASSSLS